MRYLLQVKGHAWREPFLTYLRDVAAGEPGDGGALWERLAAEPAGVEAGLHRWLAAEAASHGLPVRPPRRAPRGR